MTGTAGEIREIPTGSGDDADDGALGEFVITVREAGVELHLLGEAALSSIEPWVPGSRVTVVCELSVVADYEWDAFQLPQQVRGSWQVERVVPADDASVYLDLTQI